MTNLRFNAVEVASARSAKTVETPSNRISDYFGEDCFGLPQMKAHLAPGIYKKVESAVKHGTKIDEATADAVATSVATWAISKGATHHTHWFQPLTGSSAEKHDSFFDYTKGIETFKGSTLVQQEPDASSFPNGGIRATNQARGYTGWDPSSPIFIVDKTLCIPTVFVSFTGDTLDYKTPLLKAQEAINKATIDVCQYFEEGVTSISASLGCEQEYFLVDKAFYVARPDLYITGRTLFGAKPPHGQQLDDHYFGSIAPRVNAFMKDFEYQCHKLGIPITTRHNEVAPGQFEAAPLYEEINTGVDHNLLMMDIMEKVAGEHNFAVLLHEKPFAGLNGSGKHNNWSLITNKGRNLFDPEGSLYFLTFLVNTVKAVHKYADLLRASIASAGNDHRLGANEAPPAIMSVFLGSSLTAFLDEVAKTGKLVFNEGDDQYIELGLDKIPGLKLDTTDRNRTSPFAFTGNKFEFRAVGSTQNTATPMTVLNLIVAEQLTNFKESVDAAIAGGKDKEAAIRDVLVQYIKESEAIRFEGDGYSQEWVEEAESRGLSNVKDTPRALDFFISKEAKEIFAKQGVFTEREIEARHDVWSEIYSTKIDIESKTMEELVLNKVLPASASYVAKLSDSAVKLKDLGLDASSIITTIEEVTGFMKTAKEGVAAMVLERDRVLAIEDTNAQAVEFCDSIKAKYFDTIREAVDRLELFVDDAEWPLPKYSEMLLIK
ncbi:glutamine synthetase III family protein [Flammeovirga kamogawensis]|uniref:Glutamine synthetase III n=1 Tax=Flammeovirga kamogawensis TaxID=373891 RepID=A0ABX8H1H2_9BACT|nr:glutamine synthetase III [Flammeovirga kamogawensis]MBB6459437.1 glutamine synthetase [Flammeovirga kamogawensis]QWG08990.1 glutamine synthetase III [Flammeovirga kamogawensis]TRX67281.1 glutamine synthetase type III [Flammeovirga kamogawensis]